MRIHYKIIHWHPGKDIRKLPKIIQPFAILFRNILMIFAKETEMVKEIRKSLSFGVEYVYSCFVDGDVAEFGTMSGTTASFMAHEIAMFNKLGYQHKKLYLFDSFEGLPEAEATPDKESPQVKSGVWGAGTCYGISKEKLRKKCVKHLPNDNVVIYDGWFKDTLHKLPEEARFSMLHIDCDLYQSTIEVLDYLFEHKHIEEGTTIFFDDYNCNKASPELGERKAWTETVEKFSVQFTDCGEYGTACRKFIVHSYKKGTKK